MVIVKAFMARPRLLMALSAMALFAIFLPARFAVPARLLIAWDIGAILYLVLAGAMMLSSDVSSMRRRAPSQDEGATFVLAVVVLATFASLAAIFLELFGADAAGSRGYRIGLVAVTILCSWMFVHVSFSMHYAHDYYGEDTLKRGGGLRFPKEPEPDYWDFLYFAVNIGAAAQTSDVMIESRAIRRLVLAHSVLSFFYNTMILALAVNLAASAK